ncbi:MAG TPA: hypothetical protein DCP68_06020 [Ruminococcus sp.]|nr:hypothetical protein [Ruminococcus sp.]
MHRRDLQQTAEYFFETVSLTNSAHLNCYNILVNRQCVLLHKNDFIFLRHGQCRRTAGLRLRYFSAKNR